MLNRKPKPEIANVKKRLDSVFGSYNKFSEMINSSSGSSIYGVPNSFNILEHRNQSASSNSYPSSSNYESSTSYSHRKMNTESQNGYGPINDGSVYSATHISRPPTVEVLQSMQSLVKDELLKNLDCSTNLNCVVEDYSVPSTSKRVEMPPKNISSGLLNGSDRKRNIQDSVEIKSSDLKRSKKTAKADVTKHAKTWGDKNSSTKLNRELQQQLFGDFVSDEESNYLSTLPTQQLEKKRKKLNSSQAPTSLLTPSYNVSSPTQPVATTANAENNKPPSVSKHALLPKDEKLGIRSNKEGSTQATEGNSPRIIIKISRPLSNCSASATPPANDDLIDQKEKKKRREKEYRSKKQEKFGESPRWEEKKREKKKQQSSSSTNKVYTTNEPLKAASSAVPSKSTASTASPESNDLHSPDSGFVDVISNGTPSLGASTSVNTKHGKAANSRNGYDTRTDVEFILEQFGRVSPLLSPIHQRMHSSPQSLPDPAPPTLSPSNKPAKISSPAYIRKSHISASSVHPRTILEELPKETRSANQDSLCRKLTLEDANNNDFSCQLKLGGVTNSIAEFFPQFKTRAASKMTPVGTRKNFNSVKTEIIVTNENEDNAKFTTKKANDINGSELELAQKQAIFEQRIKIKDDIIQSHEMVIAEQRTHLENLERENKNHTEEIEAQRKTISFLKKENEALTHYNAALLDKNERLIKKVEKMARELEDLRKRGPF